MSSDAPIIFLASAILGTVQYYLNVSNTQMAGAYTGDITFTLTGAP